MKLAIVVSEIAEQNLSYNCTSVGWSLCKCSMDSFDLTDGNNWSAYADATYWLFMWHWTATLIILIREGRSWVAMYRDRNSRAPSFSGTSELLYCCCELMTDIERVKNTETQTLTFLSKFEWKSWKIYSKLVKQPTGNAESTCYRSTNLHNAAIFGPLAFSFVRPWMCTFFPMPFIQDLDRIGNIILSIMPRRYRATYINMFSDQNASVTALIHPACYCFSLLSHSHSFWSLFKYRIKHRPFYRPEFRLEHPSQTHTPYSTSSQIPVSIEKVQIHKLIDFLTFRQVPLVIQNVNGFTLTGARHCSVFLKILWVFYLFWVFGLYSPWRTSLRQWNNGFFLHRSHLMIDQISYCQ